MSVHDTADGAADGAADRALIDRPTSRGRWTSIGLFVATLCSVFLVYGYQWMGGSPFTHPDIAWGSARFAGSLMILLLAHEMGHYFVARAHGFRLSLPYFLPVPFAFGTVGAVIRLKSLPRDRTGLLEMGAAGPLAGFLVALLLIAVGLQGTVEHDVLEVVFPSADALQQVLTITPPVDPGLLDRMMSLPPLVWLVPPPGTWQVMILANPPIMDLLGQLVIGHAPGRYAELDPLAMAGWVGCLVTGINLLPIGQLDGGHVF
ncbi:MAG: site-2 protease family protein, partial [Oligoflexia bacterium]|nr:site-2 protease family protein [Oligoflexia bacterium]